MTDEGKELILLTEILLAGKSHLIPAVVSLRTDIGKDACGEVDEELGLALLRTGFEGDNVLTERGLMIEHLIDRIHQNTPDY